MSEAIFGFLGVIVGSLIPWVREWWSERWSRENRAQYLAARVVCILDEFAELCVNITQDNGKIMGQPAGRDENGQEYYIAQVSPPEPPDYPDDVDWKSIDSKLMYSLFDLSRQVRKVERVVSDLGKDTSCDGEDDFFVERGQEYARLGLTACKLANNLRKEYKLQQKDYREFGWNLNPENTLKEFLDKTESLRESNAAS